MENDDPFYLLGFVAAPCAPRLPETVWELFGDHKTWTCELRYHGEWGVEAQIFYDGDFCISRHFQTRTLAVQWAEAEWRVLKTGRDDDPVSWES